MGVNLFTQLRLEEGQLTFSGRLKNESDATITTLSWPVIGDLVPPVPTDSLFRENLDYGTMKRTPLWPQMGNERGYYGANYRGNPLHDPDERLGTWDDLKTAISKTESLGVRVILFNKFVWADVTRPDYSSFLNSAAVDPYGMPYYHPGYEYQTPVQWMSINNRRFMVACLHDPNWIDLCKREFEKSLSLGASGVLYDEAFHHYAATHCFSAEHGHRVPATLASADVILGQTFRELLQRRDRLNFVLCAEAPFDLEHQYYALSYFRIFDGHIPAERYADPFYPIMIAVTGFDDREMINRALLYRYVISYEPYNFKGDLSDFPLTVEYGKRVDAFRARYSDYLWNAEFQDSIGAKVNRAPGGPISYSVFWHPERRLRAVVFINDDRGSEHEVTLELDGTGPLFCASPEFPELESCASKIVVPPRSALVVFQKP